MDLVSLICRHLRERREALSDHVSSGALRNYEDYRHAIGSIQEVDRLLAEVKDIEQRLLDAD